MKEKLIQTALGTLPADLVLKNANILNVFTGEILPGDITVTGGMIACVGESAPAKEVIDLEGRIVAPGLIDAHCHVESSMVVPAVYCAEAVRKGVTTLITDPHEITNVYGARGVQFMLDSAACAPVNFYVMLPSCVPSTDFENTGATFTAKEMAEFVEDPKVLGLGEMMNYPGVVGCDSGVMEKLRLFSRKVIDGHIPHMGGNRLQAYICGGIETDHESASYEVAREKLRAGMAVLVREGSASKNLHDIIEGVLRDGLDTWHMAFCTDDMHLSDLRHEGSILHCIRQAIALGMPPVQAVQMGTINAARIYRLRDLGAVAPGYRADFIVLDRLETMRLHSVYKDGVCIGDERTTCLSAGISAAAGITDTVHLPPLTEADFLLPKREVQPIINLMRGQITTQKTEMSQPEAIGLLATGRLRKIAVVERHHATGNIGIGLIAGYGLSHGAIASTVAHDSHNMIIIGDNDSDMLDAAHELRRVHGGYTLVVDGHVLGTLPLPVGGLMSTFSADEFIPALDEMLVKARAMGVARGIDPFITLSFMALPVLPEIRLTDMGLFDVTQFRFI